MYERDLDHARDHARDDVTAEARRPGRASASAGLEGPKAPIASGIVMRKARDANGVAPDAEAAVATAATSSGSSLPVALQRKFESSLGADLSSVRVHTGAESQTAARAVGARAYTVGQDIHFGAGQYDPSSGGGQHLLAHEVAHTVQQRGGSPTRQNKLEVSGPQDAAEHEADRAADAMVSGAPAMIGDGSAALARKVETNALADRGEQAMMAGDAKQDLVLHVSNANDIDDATAILGLLQENQGKLEQGAAMISPHQHSPGEYIHDMMHGKDSKLVTQVPLEAIGHNQAIITDLEQYLIDARGQETVTSEFQDQYKVLLANYGRIEGVASQYAGTSLKTMKQEDAAAVVNDAAGAGGHATDDLRGTFQQLLETDPMLVAARQNVQSTTKALEAMPARMSTNMTTCVSALQTMDGNIATATIAQKGVNSLQLRDAFAKAAAKGKEAQRLSGSAKDLLMTGGEAAAKSVASATAQAVVGSGAMTMSKWGAIAAGGATTGGTAIASAAADKLVIEPAKNLLDKAIRDANAAVGIIESGAQLDANMDAEQQKQDTATLETCRAAKAALTSSFDTAVRTMSAWVKSAVEFEVRKAETTSAFTQFKAAIQAAASKRGKGSEGKALAEMAGFLEEAEQFVVQANAVIDIGKKGLGNADVDSLKLIEKARASLSKIKGRYAWLAHSYNFTKADGETVAYFGAQQVYLKIIGPGLDASPAELAGKGRADGFQTDAAANTQAANHAIPGVIPQVEGMRDKVVALRNEIMGQVFG